jgi:ABC-type transporter Mla subunit MlaD
VRANAIGRWLAVGALAAGVVVVVLLLTGQSPPTFSTVVPAATNLGPGTRISDGATNIGGITEVVPVDGGRKARIVMEIKDDKYWPVRSDAKLEIRYGGTASFSNRYLRLVPGRSGSELTDGGTLPGANVDVPVELDQLINEFTPDVRSDIQGVIGASAATFSRGAKDTNELLTKTPELAENVRDVFVDLIQDKQSLRTLVQSTQRTVEAVDRADPDLRVLLDGAAQTFDAIGDESGQLRVALDRFPAALRQTRTTLGRAGVTLNNIAGLTDDLAPGVDELRRLTPTLLRTMTTLRGITPSALNVLAPTHERDVRVGGTLLFRTGDTTPRLTSLSRQAATEIGCVRPWSPEIVLLGSTWGDWISPVDNRDHLLRATVQNYLPAQHNNQTYTAGEAVQRYPGLEYGFPRPPGALADQPWFQPQCGVGPDAVDPTKDVEGQTFKANQLPPELQGDAP